MCSILFRFCRSHTTQHLLEHCTIGRAPALQLCSVSNGQFLHGHPDRDPFGVHGIRYPVGKVGEVQGLALFLHNLLGL